MTQTLPNVFTGIPYQLRRRVYKALVATKLLVQAYVNEDGSCGCPLVVAACAVANEPVTVLLRIPYLDPVIAERLGITEQEVRSFIRTWDRTGFLGRKLFKLAIWQALAKLSIFDALASITPKGILPIHFGRRRA